MTTIHCRCCWQPISLLAKRCTRCGDLDKCRIRRAIAKLALFLSLAAIVLGVTAWFC
jgi:predicted nucleic acid-binding Zn ribbon protein